MIKPFFDIAREAWEPFAEQVEAQTQIFRGLITFVNRSTLTSVQVQSGDDVTAAIQGIL